MPRRKSIADGFDHVTRIDKYEYSDFDDLQSIELHANIVALGIQTFRYCSQLRRIDVSENNRYFSSVDGVLFDKHQEVLICYPANKIGSAYTVPETVKRIEDFAFSSSRLLDIRLNAGLLEIGDCAFEGCSVLSKIVLPRTLESIGHVAFQGCSKIKRFHIPKSLKYISFPALPPYLHSISVADNHSRFCVQAGVLFNKDMSVLYQMPRMYSDDCYYVPETVKHIEGGAFQHCSQVSTIYVPETVRSIGAFAFAFMSSKQIIKLPKRLYVNIDEIGSPFSLSDATFETY